MKVLRFLLIFLLSIMVSYQVAFAWNLEFGARRQVPQMTVADQEYNDKDDQKTTIKPELESIAEGFSYHLGLRIDAVSIDLDSATFEFKSSIESTHEAVTEDTDLDCTITETRLGLNYHLERELAGIFAGIGVSNAEEELKSDTNTWTYSTSTPYFKIGLDFIFGAIVLRYEQIYMSLGNHIMQTTSGGILVIF